MIINSIEGLACSQKYPFVSVISHIARYAPSNTNKNALLIAKFMRVNSGNAFIELIITLHSV